MASLRNILPVILVIVFSTVCTTLKKRQMKGDGGNIKIGKYTYGEGLWIGRPLIIRRDKNNSTYCHLRNRGAGTVIRVNTALELGPPVMDTSCLPYGKHSGIYREQCSPQSPNGDATETSYSQVHDALFHATYMRDFLKGILPGNLVDSAILGCLKAIQVWTHVPSISGSKHCYNPSSKLFTAMFARSDDNLLDYVSSTTVGHAIGRAVMACEGLYEPTGCQAKAIQASFADLSGIVLKASLNLYDTDWRYGSEVLRDLSTQTAIRYMDKPSEDGVSIDHVRDFGNCVTEQDTYRYAGIFNKAIYNLTSKKSWNIRSVYRVFLRAVISHWTNKDTFSQAVCGLVKACKDIREKEVTYRPTSKRFNFQDVEDAFASVGVYCDTIPSWTKRSSGAIKSFYKVFPNNVTWTEAVISCTRIGAKLLTITDQSMTAWINSGSMNLVEGSRYWLGASNIGQVDDWQWLHSASPFNYTNWLRSGQTNKPDKCLTLKYTKRELWGWQANHCDAQLMPFICQL